MGSSTFRVTVQDNGGTANGGQDTSFTRLFTIAVNSVNDAPSVVAANPPAVNEDSTTQILSGWAAMDPGPANEGNQSPLGYTVTSISNPSLFSVLPTVGQDGTLRYRTAANAYGSSTFCVSVRDSGGTANGGVDTSAARTFTISTMA